jgi:3-oxoacyl-[acyl-carrier-protein] synthase II
MAASHLNIYVPTHPARPRRRVVVTGIGVISPSGNDARTVWENVSHGRSAAAPITKFETRNLPVKIAAEVRNFDIRDYTKVKSGRLDHSIQFGIAAAAQALRGASLDPRSGTGGRMAVVEGTTISGTESTLQTQRSYLEASGDYRKIHPYNVVAGYCGEGSSAIGTHLGIQGPAMTYCSGCASGTDAIGHAMHLIRDDAFDTVVAGGSEHMVEMMHIGFCRLRAMSEHQGDPREAMRPFDNSRDGFVLGEGSAFLVLEELTHALERGVQIYAEIVGHGTTAEAFHATDPHPDGLGYCVSMQQALHDGAVHISEVDYINAHGSATPKNDPIETAAIKQVFGSEAARLGISATKPVTGHLMGASGAIETLITVLALHYQMMPPTINLRTPGAGCDLDYVSHPRRYPIRAAMNNNAGFGGRYASLLLRQFEG